MMKNASLNNKGFTLVELLIVVIILAVLAAIVVPQFGSSTEDAKVSTIKTDLAALRNAIELYYHQHDSRYPGVVKETDGDTDTDATTCPAAFVAQLTQYSDRTGKTSGTKTGAFQYGPYIKAQSLPANPFLTTNADDVECDVTEDDLTVAVAVDGNPGWKFYTKIGRFVANDNTTLTDGTTNTSTF
jgi:prepilin-type N-terminal cleavage/methylation domain-containing protein